MHITQRDVIAKLMYAEELRYSEIKPADMSGNQFSYHLEKLMQEKYVEKNINGLYSLTIKGMELTDRLSYKTMRTTRQPKLAVALFMEGKSGEVLLQRRGRQPYPNTWLLPASRIRLGETPEQTLNRVVSSRMEASDVSSTFSGVVGVRYLGDNQRFVTDLMYLIYTADEGSVYVPNSGRYVFADLNEQAKLFPGTPEIVKAIRRDESLSHVDIDLSSY